MAIDFQSLLPALQNKLFNFILQTDGWISVVSDQGRDEKARNLIILIISDIIILLADIPCSLLVKGSDEHLNTKVTTC